MCLKIGYNKLDSLATIRPEEYIPEAKTGHFTCIAKWPVLPLENILCASPHPNTYVSNSGGEKQISIMK